MPSGTPSIPATELGARLRDLRVKRRSNCLHCGVNIPDGWTQWDLADKLGTRANRVSDWETGRHEPTLPLLQRIADVYGLTVAELLDGVM